MSRPENPHESHCATFRELNSEERKQRIQYYTHAEGQQSMIDAGWQSLEDVVALVHGTAIARSVFDKEKLREEIMKVVGEYTAQRTPIGYGMVADRILALLEER